MCCIIDFKNGIKKGFNYLLVFYLSLYISGCAVTRPEKPPVSVARALETRIYKNQMSVVLKSSINALQDMNYTIDLLNSDVGLITASRTTEEQQGKLDDESIDDEDNNILRNLVIIGGVIFVIGTIWTIVKIISNNDEDDEKENKKTDHHHHHYNRNKNDDRDSPKIYKYKITVNLNQKNENTTDVRVSAAGEIEQNGRIIQTGGIHEAEFFQKFFSHMNKALFLEENSNGWIEE